MSDNPKSQAASLSDGKRLVDILMPYASERREKHDLLGGRFAHYTSATSALNIIRSKKLWMRNTTAMSDYREVQHGFQVINQYLNRPGKRDAFLHEMDGCAVGAAGEALAIFDRWWNDIQVSTYVTSISEHYPAEDVHGRLSMWRAFSRSTAKVAIIIKNPATSSDAAVLNLLFSPVAYFTDAEMDAHFTKVLGLIRSNAEFLKSVDHTALVNAIFYMFALGVICLKHEGFHEEREWRIIYSPRRMPSPLMKSSIETVDSVPQTIFAIPFDGVPAETLATMMFAKIFDRLIIGPSPFPWVMYEAFVTALTEAGVEDAAKKVFVSGIPIRS